MAEYWVDNVNGNDGGAGDQENPWKDLEIVMETKGLGAGDIVNVVTTGTPYYVDMTLTTGTYSPPITIRAETPENPPVVNKGPWIFDGASGYVISGFDFNGYVNNPMFDIGPTTRSSDITIEDCKFRHSSNTAIRVLLSTNLTVSGCLFRDIRQRVASSDRNAIIIFRYADVIDMVVEDSYFESIGSDGIHLLDNAGVDGLIIRRCYFWVNRPHGPTGTSWYDGETTTWDDFPYTGTKNVGENGIDIKGGGAYVQTGIVIQDCKVWGFRTTVAGQDCSGAGGEGLEFHDEVGANGADDAIVIERCEVYDCERQISFGLGTGSVENVIVRNCVVRDPYTGGGAGYHFRFNNPINVRLYHNTVIGSGTLLYSYATDTDTDVVGRNNVFRDGGWSGLSSPDPGQSWDFDYNLFEDTSAVPSAIQGANDQRPGEAKLDAAYRFPSTSDCRNNGVNAGVTDDYYQQTRPKGGGYDIGAVELLLQSPLPIARRPST